MILLFFFKQELSVLVLGRLPLDVDEAGLRNILSKIDDIREKGFPVFIGRRSHCSSISQFVLVLPM